MAHPFVAVGPNALLHNAELSSAQLFVDENRIRRYDMFVVGHFGRRIRWLGHIIAGRRWSSHSISASAAHPTTGPIAQSIVFPGILQEAFYFAEVAMWIVFLVEFSEAPNLWSWQAHLFQILVTGVFQMCHHADFQLVPKYAKVEPLN